MAKKNQKPSELFSNLKEGLEAAIEFAQGRKVRGTSITKVSITPVRKRTPAQIKALRTKLDMSQALFAGVLGVSKKAIEAWEAGSRSPSGPALRMFEILEKEARIIERVGIFHKKEDGRSSPILGLKQQRSPLKTQRK